MQRNIHCDDLPGLSLTDGNGNRQALVPFRSVFMTAAALVFFRRLSPHLPFVTQRNPSPRAKAMRSAVKKIFLQFQRLRLRRDVLAAYFLASALSLFPARK
ncbi:hypothetical protein ACRQ5D_31235 [Mucilaginibacter sp. P25]|uniref:hypothetical protein n=1 Tax=Mucilaginibacter sp. P25 TaxID=3423945 RepID=UPI000B89EA0F